MIYYIADTHFSDPNTLMYSRPELKNIDEMNKSIIDNWNNTITDEDTVYHLGDIGEYKYLKELKGNIIIVLGNHDNEDDLKKVCPNIKCYDKPIIDRFCILSHAPIGFIPKEFPMINIHGHFHNFSYCYNNSHNWYEGNRYFCVSCEQINYTPISENEIMEKIGYKKV
jgi:calcineurin-like phosphoesterase family protein